MRSGSIVQNEIKLNEASKLLKALSPLGSYFTKDRPLSKWIFRGQGTDWPLLPSALRVDAQKRFEQLIPSPVGSSFNLWSAERDAFSAFFDLADRQGLPLPGDSQELRDLLQTIRSPRAERLGPDHGEWDWAGPELSITLPLIALAQHHGIPTRMLDWTRRPWVAVFFAAKSYLDKPNLSADLGDRLVVWGGYFPGLGKEDAAFSDTNPVRVITAASAANPNLRAQQGVLTYVTKHYIRNENGEFEPLDRVIEDILDKDPTRFGQIAQDLTGVVLQKFSVPQSEAKQLLTLLAEDGITYSSLFPGFSSIVDDLELQTKVR